jgi:hypothetical protein
MDDRNEWMTEDDERWDAQVDALCTSIETGEQERMYVRTISKHREVLEQQKRSWSNADV